MVRGRQTSKGTHATRAHVLHPLLPPSSATPLLKCDSYFGPHAAASLHGSFSRQFNAESFAAPSRASSSSDYCYVITRGGGTVGDHIRVLSALPLHELSIANKCSEKAITSGCLGAADAARVAPLLS